LSLQGLAERVDALVVTLGGEGSVIHADGATYMIPAVKPRAIVDPTGCGDAYRAGLLYGIAKGFDWERTASSLRCSGR
jgi:adenosine kinase